MCRCGRYLGEHTEEEILRGCPFARTGVVCTWAQLQRSGRAARVWAITPHYSGEAGEVQDYWAVFFAREAARIALALYPSLRDEQAHEARATGRAAREDA